VTAQTSFTNAKDFNGLLAKLDAASGKLAEGKNADAVQKLVDFQTTLNALATAPKPKVDPAVAQSLTAEARVVIDCINTIDGA
jgi:FIMAH domain-containing protein